MTGDVRKVVSARLLSSAVAKPNRLRELRKHYQNPSLGSVTDKKGVSSLSKTHASHSYLSSQLTSIGSGVVL
jgi:hypothetical protein